MNVVFVCAQNPWRLSGGALIRNYWMVRTLAREHTVHLVTADDATETVPADFAQCCASISRFPRPTGLAGRARRIFGALRPASSYFTSGAVSRSMQRAVAGLTARPNTCAMLDLGVRDALDGRRVPFIFNAHNTEHELQRRRAAYTRQPLRALLQLEAGRTQRVETDFLRRCLLAAACSPDDRDELTRLVPSAREKLLIVPNGVDGARYAAVASAVPSSRTILVTGSFDWQPNVVGLRWFVADVLPALRARLGSVDVRVAGRMSDALAAQLDSEESVTAVPRPSDMRDELARARIVLAPILPSSGTRLRILEAWAAGRPVATTPSGALGLRYSSDDLLVAGDAAGLAEAAARLLESEELWKRVRAGGLERSREYDWHAIGDRFLAQSAPALESVKLGA